MRKSITLKIISVIVSITFVFSTGLLVGFNFYSIKNYLFPKSPGAITESSVGFSDIISEDVESKFSIRPLEETIDLIYEKSIYSKSRQELLRIAIEAMLGSLNDRHAEYFTPEEYRMVMESYSGIMSGIGIIVTVNDKGEIVIVKPLEDTPAFNAGFKAEDIILKVNGKEVTGISLEKVVPMIRGEEGTSVNLTIYRPNENIVFEVDITRERFYVPNLYSEMIDENIGYIQYINFQHKGAEKLKEEIQKLIEGGAEGIIFDLRNNLGGTLEDALAVSDLFLDEGVIVTIEGRPQEKEDLDVYYAKEGGYSDIPMVVIINEYTASASELAAGALKENKRTILIGEKSFGKGTVQVIHELSDGSGIKFSTAKFYLPSGISIETRGISPDIVVKLDPDILEDLQLDRAIEEIRKLINE